MNSAHKKIHYYSHPREYF